MNLCQLDIFHSSKILYELHTEHYILISRGELTAEELLPGSASLLNKSTRYSIFSFFRYCFSPKKLRQSSLFSTLHRAQSNKTMTDLYCLSGDVGTINFYAFTGLCSLRCCAGAFLAIICRRHQTQESEERSVP